MGPEQAGESSASGPPQWLQVCQRFLQWGGIWGGTLILTAVATAFSAVYSSLLIAWLEPGNFQEMLLVGVVVPIMLTPPIAFTVMALLTALTDAHRTVQLLADRDVLTDAFTRRYFLTNAAKRVAQAATNPHQDKPLVDSFVLLDVDDFKRINDRHGHPVGDAVLKAISATCRGQLRECDVFARYGGEEFVILLANATPDKALTIVERIRLAIHGIRVEAPSGEVVTVSASFGIAGSDLAGSPEAPAGNRRLDRILAAADQALYQAKNSGKDRAVLA